MNQGDTELILGNLAKAGHVRVTDLKDAEIVIVNTCAVKGPTQRRVLRRLQELRQLGDKRIIVAGCLPLIDLPSIDRLGPFEGMITCHSIDSIDVVVERIARGEEGVRVLEREPREKPCMPKLRLSKVSAIVAISEGCVSNCSYCSVKFARGELRSFDPQAILSEIREALDAGYREILLTGQDTAAYGIDSNASLPELLNAITELNEKFKIRVGMMNPATTKRILPELLDAYASDKIYKFLHLPVQSGDDRILAAMRRGYTVEEFMGIVNAFREKFEDLYLATDIIVGFPDEDERAFKNSCELIKRIKPDKTNLTRFSPMPGTDAAKMRQINGRVVKERSKLLSVVCRAVGHERNRKYVGRILEGLVVGKGKKGGWVMRLPNYKPAIIQEALLGKFLKIKITNARPTYLIASPLEGHK